MREASEVIAETEGNEGIEETEGTEGTVETAGIQNHGTRHGTRGTHGTHGGIEWVESNAAIAVWPC